MKKELKPVETFALCAACVLFYVVAISATVVALWDYLNGVTW